MGSVVLGLRSPEPAPAPALGADAGLEAAPDVSADEVAAPVPLAEVVSGSDAEAAPPSTPPSTESARPPTAGGEPTGDAAGDPPVDAGAPAPAGTESAPEATANPDADAGAGVSGADAAVSQGVAGA